MKLSWTEPWSRESVRRHIREAGKSIPSCRAIAIGSGVISLCAMLGVRWYLPESGEVLTVECMFRVTLFCSSYPLLPFLIAFFPQSVYLSEKGIYVQYGSGGSFLPREQIRSISFEDRDGLHLLVIRCVTKRGKAFERTVLASPKYSDQVVAQFLFSVGMSHVWSGGPEC